MPHTHSISSSGFLFYGSRQEVHRCLLLFLQTHAHSVTARCRCTLYLLACCCSSSHSMLSCLTSSAFLTTQTLIINPQQVSLKYFEEVFTSAHWMMRIYRVRDQPNRDAPKDSGRAATRKAAASA